jgi:hypothetical protein
MNNVAERMSAAGAGSSWQAPPGSPPVPGESSKGSSPVIIRDANIDGTVRLGGVSEGVGIVEKLTEAAGGFVSSSTSSTDSWLLQRWEQVSGHSIESMATNAYLSLRVPEAAFDSTRSAIRDAFFTKLGGSVASESSSARDVTAEYVDATSRAESEAASLAAMKELLSVAKNVQEILSITREMDAINSRLDSAAAQVKSLSSLATMSTISVSLRIPEPSQPSPSPAPSTHWSPLKTIEKAFANVGTLITGTIDVLLYAVIISIPLAVIFGILLALSRTSAAKAALQHLIQARGGVSTSSSLSPA